MKLTWGWVNRPAPLVDILAQAGPGWGDLVTQLINDLEKLGWDGTVLQVKEKFGGLRFYIGSASDAVFERIHKAETESYKICEICGEAGRLYRGGWWKTLCEVHAKEQGYDEEEEEGADAGR